MYNLVMNNSFFDKTSSISPKSNLKAGINTEKCKRCYKCVSRCPMNAIVMGENGYPKVDSEKCNGCKLCEKSCIDFYYENKLTIIDKDNTNQLVESIDKFLNKYKLVSPDTTLMVGFSGGFDSYTLLHVLSILRKKYGFKLCAAHLNHGWRAQESDAEEIKCKEFCFDNNIDFYCEKLSSDIPHTETAAREARYDFFVKSANYFKTVNILTAHNKTDNVETLLYRIAKGTGVRGLCGIEEKRKFRGVNIYRPILTIIRDDIEAYCKTNNLSPNNDSSNFNTKYKRNFIRHEILPLFEKINVNAKNAINFLSENAKVNEEIINEYLSIVKSRIYEGNAVKTNKFIKLSGALKQRIIYDLIVEKNLDYDRKKILDILSFIESSAKLKSGKTYSLTNDLWLFCSQKEFYFVESTEKVNSDVIKIDDIQKSYIFQNYKFTINEYISNEKIVYPKEDELFAYVDLSAQDYLELRYRKQGDKIQPFGMKNLIKLKDFFINKAVPKHKKDKIVLLCNHKEVLWACSVGLSEKLRVNDRPTHIIRIEEV